MSDEQMIPTYSFFHDWKYLLIIIIAVVLVYGQTLDFDFVNYDDDELIYNNKEFLSNWGNLKTAFTAHAFIGAGGESIYYRPFLVVSLIIDYHLWHLNPFGYHLTNIILHLATTLLVFFMIRMLISNRLTALFTTLIFTLHPIQTESVAWIAGRNDILLGLFIVMMMIFYLKSQQENKRTTVYYLLSIFFFTIALFTKESAVFYLLLLPTYDLCFMKKNLKGIMSRKNLFRFGLFGFVLSIYLLVRWNILGAVIGAEQLYGENKPLINRLINIPAIVAEHLKLITVPVNLSSAHPFSEIIWLTQPLYFAACLIVILLIVLIWFSWKKNRLLCFGLLWLIIGLLPVLNIVPMPRPILEHRLYVPLFGFAFLVGYGFERLSSYFNIFKYRVVWTVTLSCTLAGVSYARLPVWQNGITLFSDAVKKSPKDLHSQYSLARAYYAAGFYSESIPILLKYTQMAPFDIKGYRFLREAYYITGQLQEVAHLCKMLITLEPQNPLRYLEAGVIYEQLNIPDTSSNFYHQGLLVDSSVAEIHYRLGIVQERLGQVALAEESYMSAVSTDTPFVDAYPQLAKLYFSRNKTPRAVSLLENGLSIVKPTLEYLNLLNELYLKTNDSLKAQKLRRRFQF